MRNDEEAKEKEGEENKIRGQVWSKIWQENKKSHY